MDKYKLIEMKKRILAFGLAGVMFGTTGCGTKNNVDQNIIPTRVDIPSEYSNVDDYYKFVIKNEDAVKVYKADNIYLLYDKETYKVKEYIYNQVNILGGLGTYVELYDLKSEEMLVYCNGVATTYNEEFYNYIVNNNYYVRLNEVSDYVEGHVDKEFYSLDEIKELEPQICENLKSINKLKTKTK